MKSWNGIKMTAGALGALATLAGCAQQAPAPTVEEPAGQAGLALTVDTLGNTDVAQMAYTVTGVDCITGEPLDPAVQQQVVRDLEDLVLPGGNLDLEGAPFDGGSQHLFADAFMWLAAGCYDVVVQPLQADGSPSSDCAPASQAAVPVFDGQTTEILLISQCQGDEAGGLDVIGALNHAPQLDAVQYAPSKFTCEDEATICVVASDPDNDPIRIEWQILAGDAQLAAIEESLGDGVLKSCATFALSGPGDYQVGVTVLDLGYAPDGTLVTIEELLAQQGQALPSRDTAQLPIHAMSADACINTCACEEGFTLNAAGDACERVTQEDAQYNGQTHTVCVGNRNPNYGAWGARFIGDTPDDLSDDLVLTGDAFFKDGFSTTNGTRLNTVGIWACDAAGNPTSAPIGEWIGFTRCITVEEDGEYVVGIGTDDYLRVRIDGQPILGSAAQDAIEAVNFRYWWMVPVRLSAGTHIFEMLAQNAGGPAAFASEIYGPFAPGSTADNATMAQLDYANHIVWSTGDQLGSTFDLGTNSGFSCADGAALDLCGDSALCTTVEVSSCE